MEKTLPSFDEIFSDSTKKSLPADASFPSRPSIPTYLRSLDKQWRGGWFWQWPILIAGPQGSGKSLLLAQLIASTLLSCHKPWRVLYFDFNHDYHAQRIHRVLNLRSRSSSPASDLSRVDKLTLPDERYSPYSFMCMMRHTMLALFVVDGWNSFFPSFDGLNGLAQIAVKKQMGFLVTMRGDLEALLSQTPWEAIPYFLYITKQKHKRHRVRIWQNSPTTQIYDRTLDFQGYFVEPRSNKRTKASKNAVPLEPGSSSPSRG